MSEIYFYILYIYFFIYNYFLPLHFSFKIDIFDIS
jgi:hypothetical protein